MCDREKVLVCTFFLQTTTLQNVGGQIENCELLAVKTFQIVRAPFLYGQFFDGPRNGKISGFCKIALKKNAVPTLFDYTPIAKSTGSRKRLSDAENTPLEQKKTPRLSKAVLKRRALETLKTLDNKLVLDSEENKDETPFDEKAEESETDELQDICLTPCCAETQTLPPKEVETQTPAPKEVEKFSICTQTTYKLVKRRHAAVQTAIKPAMATVSTQTSPDLISVKCSCNLTESFVSANSDDSDETEASEWTPDEECHVEPEQNVSEKPPATNHTDRKFVVFEDCLDKLLTSCHVCGRTCAVDKRIIGTFISVQRDCVCGHSFCWESQPLSGTMPIGNLVLSASILFSGGNIYQNLNMLSHAGIQCFTERTFHNIQQLYVVPAVERVWSQHQQNLLSQIRNSNRQVCVGGDARCCSPGHTAKYGSYSLMDLNSCQILDIQLVQSNEVKNSYWMELEGLKRSLGKLEAERIKITDLVTDRHAQVKAFVREKQKDIRHWFDVWHVAKGVHKKLEAAGKKRYCGPVGEWSRSISNHLYWCAASSNGDGEMVLEKWLSVLNHVRDIHEGHGQHFTSCTHGQLEDRLWIKGGSLAYDELEKVVKGRLLLQDIRQLSPAEQTSGLEAFHKIVCQFAPKSVHFFYTQMKARLYVAALHFNENAARAQAVNKQGKPIFAVSYPKARKGSGVAKEVKVKQTFNYVSTLLDEVFCVRESMGSYREAREIRKKETIGTPKALSHSCNDQEKEDILRSHISRFNKK